VSPCPQSQSAGCRPRSTLRWSARQSFAASSSTAKCFAMAGTSWEHLRIKENVARHAGDQLEEGPCQIQTSDMRVKIDATGLYTYPDISIVCDEPQFEDGVKDTLLNPRVIIEILSESTEEYDRGAKFRHYQQVPTIQEYVLISQDKPLVEQHLRQADVRGRRPHSLGWTRHSCSAPSPSACRLPRSIVASRAREGQATNLI
jgi:Uma2 family endonuclease